MAGLGPGSLRMRGRVHTEGSAPWGEWELDVPTLSRHGP